MTVIDGGIECFSKEKQDIEDWSVEKLKNAMWELANRDPNVLRSLDEIPRTSYGNHAKYHRVYEAGRKKYINFKVAHNYLQLKLLD